MSCLTSINYTMKADIYKPYISQDDVGTVVKSFIYDKTVDCFIRTDIKRGIGDNSFNVNIEDYTNFLHGIIKLRCNQQIPNNYKIVKIRNSEQFIFLESQDSTSAGGFEGTTIFEARGSTPIINFDGSVIEYETTLYRQEIQKI